MINLLYFCVRPESRWENGKHKKNVKWNKIIKGKASNFCFWFALFICVCVCVSIRKKREYKCTSSLLLLFKSSLLKKDNEITFYTKTFPLYIFFFLRTQNKPWNHHHFWTDYEYMHHHLLPSSIYSVVFFSVFVHLWHTNTLDFVFLLLLILFAILSHLYKHVLYTCIYIFWFYTKIICNTFDRKVRKWNDCMPFSIISTATTWRFLLFFFVRSWTLCTWRKNQCKRKNFWLFWYKYNDEVQKKIVFAIEGA